MNRELRFRVWFHDPFSTRDGSYYGAERAAAEGFIEFCGQWLVPTDECSIIEQSTGLYDRNGTEIYEGDTIKDDYYHRPLAVEWVENGFWLKMDDGRLSMPNSSYMEVVGNIHE